MTMPTLTAEREAAVERAEALEAKDTKRCEHCGSDHIYHGPPDCPTCGAPNCCQICCQMESLRQRAEAAEGKLEEAEININYWKRIAGDGAIPPEERRICAECLLTLTQHDGIHSDVCRVCREKKKLRQAESDARRLRTALERLDRWDKRWPSDVHHSSNQEKPCNDELKATIQQAREALAATPAPTCRECQAMKTLLREVRDGSAHPKTVAEFGGYTLPDDIVEQIDKALAATPAPTCRECQRLAESLSNVTNCRPGHECGICRWCQSVARVDAFNASLRDDVEALAGGEQKGTNDETRRGE